METIIKYSRPKNTNNRGQNNVTIINNGGGGDIANINFDDINIDQYLYWKKSGGEGSLVPKQSFNEADGDNSVAIGEYTQTINNGELAIGMYNKSESGETYFTIGNGTDDVNRSNLFAVGKTNTIVNNHLSGQSATFNNSVKADSFSGSNASFTNLQSVSGYIQTLLSDNITVDNLTVTKAAHFFSLIIDEIRATQGQVIITPANAKIDKVEVTSTGRFRCYFKATDGDKKITNNFRINDQIVCQTFNAATGTSYNVSNTYYWRLCTSTGRTTTLIDGVQTECHYIDLSDADKDPLTTSDPESGDNIVQLGNRTDTTRQAAIIISAYNSEFLDKGLSAPSIVQYAGINDYNLAAHRRNVISKNLNEFNGTFKTTAGNDLETNINNIQNEIDNLNLNSSSNLIMNGAFIKDFKYWQNWGNPTTRSIVQDGVQKWLYLQTTTNKFEGVQQIHYSDFGITINPDETYTISLIAKAASASGATIAVCFHWYNYPSTTIVSQSWFTFNVTGTTAQKFTQTFKTPENINAFTIMAGDRDETAQSFYISNLKLEKGSNATDWTPSWQETEDDINNINVNVSTLQQTTTGLTSTVQSINNQVTANTQNISTIQQTSSQITSRVETIENNYITDVDFAKTVTVDATALDVTKCYPVVLMFYQGQETNPYTYNGSEIIRCKVNRTLNTNYGVPSYATHANGFVCSLDWTTKACGWGTNNVNPYWNANDRTRYIQDYKLEWTAINQYAIGSIGQVVQVSAEIVYVRGGSKYDVSTSHKKTNITLYPTGYTWTNGTVTETRPIINASDLVIPVQDARTYSEIKQTADNIQLNVYNELKQKTGIDVSDGSITLNAATTTVVGNLNLTDTNNGLTVYDNDGIPRVNLQPNSINDVVNSLSSATSTRTSATDTRTTTSNTVTATSSTITLTAGTDFNIRNISVSQLNTTTGTRYYPTYITIRIYKGSSLLKSERVKLALYNLLTFPEVKTSPDYYFTFSVAESASYQIEFYIEGSNSFSSGGLDTGVFFDYLRGTRGQTYIGNNGLVTNPAINNYIVSSGEKFEVRNQNIGLRLTGADYFNKVGYLETIALSSNDNRPIWLPFYNYSPLCFIGENDRKYSLQSINNTISAQVYQYRINPCRDVGEISVTYCPSTTAGTLVREAYIVLPPIDNNRERNEADISKVFSLPIGYKVRVNNLTYGSYYCKVRVIPPEDYGDAYNNTIILVGNTNSTYGDNLSYYELDVINTNSQRTTAEFMYIGRRGGPHVWLVRPNNYK